MTYGRKFKLQGLRTEFNSINIKKVIQHLKNVLSQGVHGTDPGTWGPRRDLYESLNQRHLDLKYKKARVTSCRDEERRTTDVPTHTDKSLPFPNASQVWSREEQLVRKTWSTTVDH